MQKYISEARLLLALAIPVILAQIAQTAMGFVDTVMAGGYSATDMAAVAIGTSIWLPAILFGHGLLLALTPVIAQLNGSGRRERIAHQVRQGSGWQVCFRSHYACAVECRLHYPLHGKHRSALADTKPWVICVRCCGARPAICSSRLPVTNVKVWQKPSRVW